MSGPSAQSVARVLTNETCTHVCSFCDARRPAEQPSFVHPRSVTTRIDEAIAAGARELVLTGGEPTLRRDLPALVAYAKRGGAETVSLETNGVRITAELADALRRAGLDRARVHLPGLDGDADRVTGEPGGARRSRRAVALLAAAGISVEGSLPIVRATIAAAPGMPEAIAEAGVAIEALVLFVPTHGPDEAALVPLAEAARCIEAIDAGARRVGLTLRIDPSGFIPPCVFARPARVAHLFALTRGGGARPGYVKQNVCARCEAHEQCPGVPEAALRREGAIALTPIGDERLRRRLSIASSVAEQIERELVTRDLRRYADGSTVRENIVRLNFHCNQACRFCFVSTHLPPADDAMIEAAIREIGALGGVLTLSGGEPTLHPRLLDWVRLGKGAGAREIELQTNAVRLADPPLARELEAAGVDTAFVSLHSPRAETSDRITAAPGTFAKTVRGIDELSRTNIAVRLNFVFCERNRAEFPEYVEYVAARWPQAQLVVSFVGGSTDVVPQDADLIPPLSSVVPHLAEGIGRARRIGLPLLGLEGMCGVPLCLIPDDLQRYFALAEISEGLDRGEFIKTEACRACSLSSRCFGLRRRYAELHGTTELSAVRTSD